MATLKPPQNVTPAIAMTPVKRKFYEVPTVTIFVDKSKKPFYVHLDLLCNASPFFKAAFTGNFKESSEKTMQLPEDDESTFELFVDWVYYQRYEILPETKSDTNDERYLQAFRLFVLADKYNIYKLKSLVIDKLFAEENKFGSGPTTGQIAYAYQHTTQGSALRKLLADAHAWNLSLQWYESPHVQAFLRQQPDFAADVILSFAKHLPRPHVMYNPFKGDMPEEYKEKEPGQGD